MKIKKHFWLMIIIVVFSGCSSSTKSMPRFSHSTDLMIGDPKEVVVRSTEKLLLGPKNVILLNADMPDDSSELSFRADDVNIHDVEVRRYFFTKLFDLVLYFYNDTFFQADFMPIDSVDYPLIRNDYDKVAKGMSGLKGYTLSLKGNTFSIDVIK